MVRVEVNGIRDMAASELTPINLKPQGNYMMDFISINTIECDIF